MPISDCPFIGVGNRPPIPALWIRVTNPHTGKAAIYLAIIDTGAYDCAFPASEASALDHNLKSVAPITIKTAGGETKAYRHTCKVEILETLPNRRPGQKVLYEIEDTLIVFTVGLDDFLLGCGHFLNRFVLEINYPAQKFSIRRPRPSSKAKAKSKKGPHR